MDTTDPDELLGRLAEAQGGFAHAGSSTRQDERVNDGANYAGLMSMATYKEKRAEMTVKEDVNLNRDAMVAAARAVLNADRNAKDKAATVRRSYRAPKHTHVTLLPVPAVLSCTSDRALHLSFSSRNARRPCPHTHTHAHTRRTYAHAHAHTHTHTYTHAHTHTYTHIHTYTHRRAAPLVTAAHPRLDPLLSAQDREARELARKEKLKRELAGGGEQEDGGTRTDGTAAEEPGPSKKKKKKKAAAAPGPGLSFDVDDEDG